jgi:hypothetical protein
VEVLLETVFSTVFVPRGYIEGKQSKNWQFKGAAIQRGLKHGSRGTGVVKSPYQATADTAGWKRLSVCSSDFKIVEISNSATVICSYDL